jgi:hypothetical protein
VVWGFWFGSGWVRGWVSLVWVFWFKFVVGLVWFGFLVGFILVWFWSLLIQSYLHEKRLESY